MKEMKDSSSLLIEVGAFDFDFYNIYFSDDFPPWKSECELRPVRLSLPKSLNRTLESRPDPRF